MLHIDILNQTQHHSLCMSCSTFNMVFTNVTRLCIQHSISEFSSGTVYTTNNWVLCCNTSTHAVIPNALFYCIRHPFCFLDCTNCSWTTKSSFSNSGVRVLARHVSMNKTKSNATLLLLRIHNLLISVTYKIVKWDPSI